MLTPLVELPESFASALARGAAPEVSDAVADAPQALYGRALARVAEGRDREARQDLESALPTLGDVARIELAFLDLRQPGTFGKALRAASEIAQRASSGSRLAARAWHVTGLSASKLRKNTIAVNALLAAREAYSAAGDAGGRSQVLDTLGMVEAARGRLDLAINFYSMSLIDKVLLDDRPGIAITLGNIGRAHLRAGRLHDALDCFTRDLEIACQLGDQRGRARIHNDLARSLVGLEKFDDAEVHLTECLRISEGAGYDDVRFFACKDLVLLRVGQGRLDDAESALHAAETLLPEKAESYFQLLLTAAWGELFFARRDVRAISMLEQAVRGFEEAELPDFEISARIILARALMAEKYKYQAEQCLLKGIKLARRDGYARYLTRLNTALTSLDMSLSATEETTRQLAAGPEAPQGSYLMLQRLGRGGFGEVFRAFDPERNEVVAFKRLHLDRLYSVKVRNRLLGSARVELEASSRIHHPGLVRVLALGTEPDGGAYVVQEFIDGKPLREAIKRGDNTADPVRVVTCLEQIAHALDALHAAGVVHRDLKPENVILRADGTPVLIDFGLAHFPDAEQLDSSLIAGTLEYMSPEQATGKSVGPQSDLYSLGVVAYEWLTGWLPLRFRSRQITVPQFLNEIATRPPTSPCDYRPRLPAPLVELVMSLLAKRPLGRPRRAADVADALQQLREGPLRDLTKTASHPR